ncbi:DUF4349 domain-containing protein [Cryptosporangium phraense]|uniref:DUF4349 domain-containing protein n=1 Tax=Cryptosporangium phraense TaxID=2593070 RepID=A0A545ATL7_9ACTN|nr:DUF4349 domain-containing protein [Cryptosporangium phraense]TQS44611.1 DUF4349 domain-containing protein [Cryptosporangium phraense]
MDNRKPAAFLAALIVALLVLAGCSDNSSNDSGSAADSTAARSETLSGGAPAAPAVTPGSPGKQPAGQPDAPTTLGDPKRALVYTGALSVTAQDVSDAASRAVRATLAAGGYVAGDERHLSDERLYATLTLRVPSARFGPTVDAVAALGKETARRLGTDDLQTATIDLDSRIAAQRASVTRVRALLARANSISQLAQIERELTTRESELAASEASRRTINDQVSYSTITLTLSEPSAPAVAKKKERGLWVGLRNGWDAFVVTVAVLLMVLGWLAPFLAAVALIGVPVWLLVRRVRRPAPPAAPSEPAPKEPVSSDA